MIFSAFSTALEFFEKRAFLESEKSLVFCLNSTFTACVTCIFRPRITKMWLRGLCLKFSVLPQGGLCFNPPSRLNARFSYPNRKRFAPPWRYVRIGIRQSRPDGAAPFLMQKDYLPKRQVVLYKTSLICYNISYE